MILEEAASLVKHTLGDDFDAITVQRVVIGLFITGATLVNHTLEGLLDAAQPGIEIAVMGPTASVLPEPLFNRGVRIFGGVWVKKPDDLLNILSAGGSAYHLLDHIATRIVIEKA